MTLNKRDVTERSHKLEVTLKLMCSTPKPPQLPEQPEQPKPQYLYNPILDGSNETGYSSLAIQRRGRSSLRIDLDDDKRRGNTIIVPPTPTRDVNNGGGNPNNVLGIPIGSGGGVGGGVPRFGSLRIQ